MFDIQKVTYYLLFLNLKISNLVLFHEEYYLFS